MVSKLFYLLHFTLIIFLKATAPRSAPKTSVTFHFLKTILNLLESMYLILNGYLGIFVVILTNFYKLIEYIFLEWGVKGHFGPRQFASILEHLLAFQELLQPLYDIYSKCCQ